MNLQVIKDENGADIGVFVPINDWIEITKKHSDLVGLVNLQPVVKPKLSDLFGKLSDESAEAMRKNIAEMRDEWDERFDQS